MQAGKEALLQELQHAVKEAEGHEAKEAQLQELQTCCEARECMRP